MAQKKKGRNNNRGGKNANKNNKVDDTKTISIEKAKVEEISERNAVGVLSSKPDSRDVKIDSFTLTYHGWEIVADTSMEFNHGNRYGLIGANGSGKSTLLHTINAREIPIPEHIDIFLLHQEADPSDHTAVKVVVMEVQKEYERLEALADQLMLDDPESGILQDIYDKMDDLDPNTFESRACEILHGLGFDHVMMNKATKDMSGGWRMRVALARALFIQPTLLLLDEPTNHLDLEACIWLEDYLKTYKHSLILISHSQDFLNGVCTNIINLRLQKLNYYSGNYDTYVKVRREQESNQMKAYKKQQGEIEHLQKFIRSCGTYSNLVKQAKSKQKIIDKMVAAGLYEKVVVDKGFTFKFNPCGSLPPPVLSFNKVAFAYSGEMKDALYTNMNFGVDLDSRIALVGPNGAGKSTLLKLIVGELTATEGDIGRHSHLTIGRYHQHAADTLDFEMNTLDYMKKHYSHVTKEEEQWRAIIGRYGLAGSAQLSKIGDLSDGQKSRIVIMTMVLKNPHMLLLDEPTNHLDIECIDSLAAAINTFEGGMILVSHDFRLIDQVAKEIWVCDKKKVSKYPGDIRDYKKQLVNQILKK